MTGLVSRFAPEADRFFCATGAGEVIRRQLGVVFYQGGKLSIQSLRNLGMQLMDQALMDAINAKQVDPDDAFNFCLDKKKFERFVTDTTILPKMDI